MTLNIIDYKILEFISDSNTASKDDILKKFPMEKTSIEYRLLQLSRVEYKQSKNFRIPIPNTNFIYQIHETLKDGAENSDQYPTEMFRLTELGKATLQNYKLEKQASLHKKYEEWLWRLIPISISLAAFLNSAGCLGFHK